MNMQINKSLPRQLFFTWMPNVLLNFKFIHKIPYALAFFLILITQVIYSAMQLPDVFTLSAEHIAAVNQQRRIYYQYDGSSYEPPELLGGNMDLLMRYRFGYVDQPGSQIDLICLDVSNEGVVPYTSNILPFIQDPGLLKWREQGLDIISRMIDECRKRDLEIFWNHRLNEVERGDGGFRIGGGTTLNMHNPIKAANPGWLIRSWWWQGHWNLAIEDVREYKFRVLTELAELYEFDGFQIDFLRHTPHLPPGRQWEEREGITQFLAEVRAMLLARGAERGRPFLLSVRIPETMEGCRMDGIDVEEWARRNLVDILVPGTRSIRVDLPAFAGVVSGKNIRLIPSFDGWHVPDGYQIQSIEFLRGVYGNFLRQGADGVGTFNWAAGSPCLALEIGAIPGPSPQETACSEIGNLNTMRNKPRFHAADRRGGYPYGEGYFSQNLAAPLPARLRNDGTPVNFPLPVWEEVYAADSVILRLVCFNLLPKDEIEVTFNGRKLISLLRDENWKDGQIYSPDPQPVTILRWHILEDLSNQKLTRLEFPVSADDLQPGDNDISIRVIRRHSFPIHANIQVEKVELHIE
jgi:hypothetical protein